jgi:hypothetical protein
MGQGRENARVFLREHKDIREKLENTLRKKLEIPNASSGATAHGPNGAAQNEKPAVHVAAAAAAGANKAAKPANAR